MANVIEIKVPDIGEFKDIEGIEILVKQGDQIKVDDPIISLESDKATMEIPSRAAATVKDIKVKAGDKVTKGALILLLEAVETSNTAKAKTPADEAKPVAAKADKPVPAATPAPAAAVATAPAKATTIEAKEIKVPDIGDFTEVPVIEVLVAVGDQVKAEDPLVTLESEKATMDVPAPGDGTVEEILVAVGDTVSEGTAILRLSGDDGEADGEEEPAAVEEAAGEGRGARSVKGERER